MKLPYIIVIQWSDEDNCYLVHLYQFNVKLHRSRSPSHPPKARGTLRRILSPPPTRGARGDQIQEQPHKKLVLPDFPSQQFHSRRYSNCQGD